MDEGIKLETSPVSRRSHSDTLTDLRATLGLSFTDEFERDQVPEPYVQYIKTIWPGRGGDRDTFLQLFGATVAHFKGSGRSKSIQSYIDGIIAEDIHAYFNDTAANSEERITSVRDMILLILGVWTLMPAYFVALDRRQKRRVVVSYCLNSNGCYSEINALSTTLPNLLKTSRLLPNPGELVQAEDFGDIHNSARENRHLDLLDTPFGLHIGLIESNHIDSRWLNAYRLSAFAGVQILRTENIARHLLLSQHKNTSYLELFSLPYAIQNGPNRALAQAGISRDLTDEISASYAALFNPVEDPSRVHRFLSKYAGLRYVCWCLTCASWRTRRREVTRLKARPPRDRPTKGFSGVYDPTIEILSEQRALPAWEQTEFTNLYPRIVTLSNHLHEATPWSFWVLFRDNRNTVQYWTFLFGSVILVLTIIQVALGVAQVVGSFE